MGKTIHIQQGKSWLITNWLSSAKYVEGSGCVELSFDPKLKPYLLDLKEKYTRYQLDIAIQFKSQYSIRLYERLKKEAQIIKEYKHKDNFEKKYSYEELRIIFSVGEKDYKLFKDFRVRVIEPAVKEISDKSDLNITQVEYLKTGRKITHICFYVTIRSREEANTRTDNLRLEDIAPEAPKEENHPIFSALENYGISFEVARKLKNEYGIKRIERNITYLNAQLKANKVINDKPAFLTQAIKDDYGNALELEEKKKKEIIAKQKAEEEAKRKQELEEKRKAEEQTQKNTQTIEAFALLPAGLRKVIKQGFMETIKDNAFKLEKWNKWQELNDDSTLKNEAFFRSEFVKYLVENNFIE
jgi:plasmid replication initiation protein